MNILTLTMNPAVDKSSQVDHVVPERKLRCQPPSYEPGGGGINVSRAIRNLGGLSMAVYPSGGAPGQLFRDLLDGEEINHQSIEVNGWTRQNLMIYETDSGQQYRFGMPGPELSREEWQACLNRIFESDPVPEFIVASGSLPPGVPDDFYGTVARQCREKNISLILDTSKQPLCSGVESGVFLIKPNLSELHTLAGCLLENEMEQEALARRLVEEKKSRHVVLSLGAAGVLAVSEQGAQRLRAPIVPIKSKVGAGDSTVAGMVLKLAEGWPFMDAVRYGVAAGAAAVMTPGSELCRRSDVESLFKQMARDDLA
jgi:6-phosphofructokinase 2